MSNPSKHETIMLFVDPNQLRRMAADMEKRMAEVGPGQNVWSESFYDGNLEVKLIADQDWFHKRERGIPDWDEMSPGPESAARFEKVDDDSYEFPNTYSGQAWRAAYRIWKVAKDNPALLDTDGWSDIPGVDLKDLDLTGFMFGWALNAVRQMLGKKPGPNPAIIEIGAGDNQPVVPAMGSANADLRRVL